MGRSFAIVLLLSTIAEGQPRTTTTSRPSTTLPGNVVTTSPDGAIRLGNQLPLGWRLELNRPFPQGNSVFRWGDNEQSPIEAERIYERVDEPHLVLGGFLDTRNGASGNSLTVGLVSLGAPSLYIASTPAPTLTNIPGSMTPTQWACFAIAWENSLGGVTKVSATNCIQASTGGVQVSMPSAWPSPFPRGKTLARIYQELLPSAPCSPSPCQPSNPKGIIMFEADYLYNASDVFNLTTNTQNEYESQPQVNSTGLSTSPFQTFEQSIGLGQFQPGATAWVGGPGAAYPTDNGWWYTIYGVNCQISADGCRGCNRSGGILVTLPNPLPTTWRTDRIPFGVAGVCFQRSSPSNTGTVFHSNGYSGGCTWRYEEPYNAPDGTTQAKITMGLCDGQLKWFNPYPKVAHSCGPQGCQ